MKKGIILVLFAAAVYPYAMSYYKNHFGAGSYEVAGSAAELAKKLSEKLPWHQGYLTYTSVTDSVGSLIFSVEDSLPVVGGALTTDQARLRDSTWLPFLKAYTCQNKTLRKAMDEDIVNNVYYQFTAHGAQVNYNKLLVTKENCTLL